MSYAVAMTSCKDSFIKNYIIGLNKFIDFKLDENVITDGDLLGMEDIIDELMVSVITPIKVEISGITTKKCILICGPKGSGRSFIGRWLNQKLKNKIYFIDIKSHFPNIISEARKNSPAVIFIDDYDVLFQYDIIYKTFLTLFDYINKDICVIITCIDIKQIPVSLFNGKFIQTVLFTTLPDKKQICITIERLFNTMITILPDNSNKDSLRKQFMTEQCLSNIANKMSGFNYSDIHQCFDNLSRFIISSKNVDLQDLFVRCIKQIRQRYELCETNMTEYYDSYIG